jgi:hypothetical protein
MPRATEPEFFGGIMVGNGASRETLCNAGAHVTAWSVVGNRP